MDNTLLNLSILFTHCNLLILTFLFIFNSCSLGLFISKIFYVASVCGIVLMYSFYGRSLKCSLNIFFITWTAILLTVMMAISLHSKVYSANKFLVFYLLLVNALSFHFLVCIDFILDFFFAKIYAYKSSCVIYHGTLTRSIEVFYLLGLWLRTLSFCVGLL